MIIVFSFITFEGLPATIQLLHKQTLEKSKKRRLKLTKLPKRKCQSNNECTNVFLVYVHLRGDS